MPYDKLPAFMLELEVRDSMAARALKLTIYCASRSGEVLGANWEEIDLENAVWTVPRERMKAGRPHRVPLSRPALALLKTLNEPRISEFVFPGQKIARPLLPDLSKRIPSDVLPHPRRE
jgi:integrase